MKNKILKIFVGEILLLGLLLMLMSVIKMIPSQKTVENNSQNTTYFRKIFESDNYSNDFIASNNGLKRIEVLFKNPNLESRDDIEIILLRDKTEIFRNSYNGYNFGDTSWARIDFKKIDDSKNSKFTVVVRGVKNVDGKLELGVKNNEINIIQYYGEKLTLTQAFKASMRDMVNIIQNQTIVLALPLILWGIFLW